MPIFRLNICYQSNRNWVLSNFSFPRRIELSFQHSLMVQIDQFYRSPEKQKVKFSACIEVNRTIGFNGMIFFKSCRPVAPLHLLRVKGQNLKCFRDGCSKNQLQQKVVIYPFKDIKWKGKVQIDENL